MPFSLSDTACIIVALIINASSYVAEIIRAGIQAVDKGQTEAARSLGLTAGHTMSKVVLPQAVKNILPALGNEFINMIKQVSLASVFFINELTTSYRTVLAATYRPIEAIVIAGMIYLLVTTVLSQIVELAEWRMRKMNGAEKGMPILQVEGLKKSFGKLEVLRGIDEQIREGEAVSIIGPSGGGKSTFLRCLNLLETPTAGNIYFRGVNVMDKRNNIDRYRQRSAWCFRISTYSPT